MKKRNGFVSNSSSSSFICDSCGGSEEGMDLCLSEAEMFNCHNGHTIHESCAPNFSAPSEDDENYDEDWRYEGFSGVGCPLCSLSEINSDIKASYLMALHGYTKEGIFKEITAFGTLDKLNERIAELNNENA